MNFTTTVRLAPEGTDEHAAQVERVARAWYMAEMARQFSQVPEWGSDALRGYVWTTYRENARIALAALAEVRS